jgi:uncharacterized protein
MPRNMARITITVKPKSSCRGVTVNDGKLVVAVTAPPAEGKANEMCIALVADWLSVPKSRLTLVSGLHHKEKVIEIADMDQAVIDSRLVTDN